MKKYLIHILSSLSLMLILSACSDLISDVDTSDTLRQITLRVTMPVSDKPSPGSGHRISASQQDGTLNLITRWDDGDKVKVFITQDSKTYSLGEIKVSDISEDGKHCSLQMTLPSAIDKQKTFTITGLTGVDATVEGDGKIYATCNLTRSSIDKTKVPMWFRVTGVAQNFSTELQHLGAYEVLHVKNNTNFSMVFAHYGYQTQAPWYKKTDKVLIGNATPQQSTSYTQGESLSELYNVPANSSIVILSWYIPNGAPVSNAKLIAHIEQNGKSGVYLSDNTKTSDVSIQSGRAYHLYVEWDGAKLKFNDSPASNYSQIKVTTDKEIGEQFTFELQFEYDKVNSYWIDINNNGILENNEDLVEDFYDFGGGIKRSFELKSSTFTINLSSIRYLNLSSNSLTGIDFSKYSNVKLEELSLDDNKLQSLDVSNLSQLEYLQCMNNQLQSLDVSNLSQLKYLECWDNQLQSLDVSNLSQLEFLECEHNQLQSLVLSNHPMLRDLVCRDNPNMGSLSLSFLPNLRNLNAVNCGLQKLDVRNNPKLIYLLCDDNKLTTIDVSKNTQLECVGIGWNNMGTETLNAIYQALPSLNGKQASSDLWWPEGFKMLRSKSNPGFADSDKSIAEKKGWDVEDKWIYSHYMIRKYRDRKTKYNYLRVNAGVFPTKR